MKPIVETANIEADKDLKRYFTISGKPLGAIDDKEVEEDVETQGYTPEELSYNPELIVQEFHISPLIRDIEDYLIGPPQDNMQNAEYIQLIPKITKTNCFKKDRCIVITGEKSCVEDAINRFKVLETIYVKGSNKIKKAHH